MGGSPGGCAGGSYRAAGRIGVRAWVGRPANSSARIAGERCGRRKASLTSGPGRSAGEAGSACGPGARRRQAAGRAVRSWAKCVTRDWAERGRSGALAG